MLLTITTTHSPATDLGYLLHKSPDRTQSFDLSFGKAHVFYPEATTERCTAALLLDIDPIELVRGRAGSEGGGLLAHYVNDRPYAASSFMSVALNHVFRSAMAGSSKSRPELVETPIPLLARVSVLPCRGGQELLHRLFSPLGYRVVAEGYPLDERFPEWGDSDYFTVTLEATVRLKDLLSHLYVLIPVLDLEKHYWVGKAEVEKLLRHADWLATHPEKDLITKRYLKYQHRLTRDALERLVEDTTADPDQAEEARSEAEDTLERQLNLNERRLEEVVAVLRDSGAKRIADLGCGDGKLLERLIKERGVDFVLGMDVSMRTLERAKQRLHLDDMPEMQRKRLGLMQGSLTYRDRRLEGFDAAAVVEVIEHLDQPRLAAFEQVLFTFARPRLVALTTPNAEYNVRFESLPAGNLRHADHRFEWTRAQFQGWAHRIADQHGYTVRFLPVGPEDPEAGAPTQMGVFTLESRA